MAYGDSIEPVWVKQADGSSFRVSSMQTDANLQRTSAIQGDAGFQRTSAIQGDAALLRVSNVNSLRGLNTWTSAFDIDTTGGVAVVNGLAGKKIYIHGI